MTVTTMLALPARTLRRVEELTTLVRTALSATHNVLSDPVLANRAWAVGEPNAPKEKPTTVREAAPVVG
jgi:hypothetical protein